MTTRRWRPRSLAIPCSVVALAQCHDRTGRIVGLSALTVMRCCRAAPWPWPAPPRARPCRCLSKRQPGKEPTAPHLGASLRTVGPWGPRLDVWLAKTSGDGLVSNLARSAANAATRERPSDFAIRLRISPRPSDCRPPLRSGRRRSPARLTPVRQLSKCQAVEARSPHQLSRFPRKSCRPGPAIPSSL
jgi:hypothetical protein